MDQLRDPDHDVLVEGWFDGFEFERQSTDLGIIGLVFSLLARGWFWLVGVKTFL